MYNEWPLAGFAFLLGCLFGSFANVAILRYLSGDSIIWPGSRCPHCHAFLKWYDNIPIFSALFLKLKCRYCSNNISWQYPMVELLTGLLFLSVYLNYGLTWTSLELFILVLGLVIVSGIDLKSYLLPDVYTLPGILIGLLGAWLNPERHLVDSILGVLVGGGILWSLAYFYFLWRKQEGMGGGDIKLLAWLGAVLGWEAIPFTLLVSSIVGSLAGLLTMPYSQKGFRTIIPFGPFLAFGGLLYALGGRWIAEIYNQFMLPFLF